MEKMIEKEPESLVELMDIILSKVCRGLKTSRRALANACTEMEGFGINPDTPEPEKIEILIDYVSQLKDENGNAVFTAMEIREYRYYLRKLRRQ